MRRWLGSRAGMAGMAVVALVALTAVPLPVHASGEDLPDDEAVLRRLARVAGLYRDHALRFTCRERIHYTRPGVSELFRFDYIYRYSGQRGVLEDYRTARDGASRALASPGGEVDLNDLDLPAFLLRAYSWIFLFDPALRESYEFEVGPVEPFQDREAIRIRFDPIPPFRRSYNDWAGTAWVDCESYQVLRVEANHVDDLTVAREFRDAIRERGDPGGAMRWFTITHFTTDFDVEKNGLRFPGRVYIERVRHYVDPGTGEVESLKSSLYQVSQVYRKYRFFGVRTSEEIQRIVLSD